MKMSTNNAGTTLGISLDECQYLQLIIIHAIEIGVQFLSRHVHKAYCHLQRNAYHKNTLKYF